MNIMPKMTDIFKSALRTTPATFPDLLRVTDALIVVACKMVKEDQPSAAFDANSVETLRGAVNKNVSKWQHAHQIPEIIEYCSPGYEEIDHMEALVRALLQYVPYGEMKNCIANGSDDARLPSDSRGTIIFTPKNNRNRNTATRQGTVAFSDETDPV